MAKHLGIPKHSASQPSPDAQNAPPPDRSANDSLPDSELPDTAALQEQTSRMGEPDTDFPGLPGEPLPIGHALARVMRAVMFSDPPSPEMDVLPLAQLRLLWTVFHASQATMKDLSERLGVSQSTVTQIADRLVKRGLVERRADPDDRRIVRLGVSAGGREILLTARNRDHQTIRAIWEAMTPSEQTDVVRGLETLARTAEAVRVAQNRPLPPMPYHEPSPSQHPSDVDAANQPIVDLMTRRVRGKPTA